MHAESRMQAGAAGAARADLASCWGRHWGETLPAALRSLRLFISAPKHPLRVHLPHVHIVVCGGSVRVCRAPMPLGGGFKIALRPPSRGLQLRRGANTTLANLMPGSTVGDS